SVFAQAESTVSDATIVAYDYISKPHELHIVILPSNQRQNDVLSLVRTTCFQDAATTHYRQGPHYSAALAHQSGERS
ncbi:hypothetical protein ABHI18_010659, partial [Aspergillus niger]